MLETMLLLMGLASCALVLIAFRGSDLLGTEWRKRH